MAMETSNTESFSTCYLLALNTDLPKPMSIKALDNMETITDSSGGNY
jgi:hypothetical protein